MKIYDCPRQRASAGTCAAIRNGGLASSHAPSAISYKYTKMNSDTRVWSRSQPELRQSGGGGLCKCAVDSCPPRLRDSCANDGITSFNRFIFYHRFRWNMLSTSGPPQSIDAAAGRVNWPSFDRFLQQANILELASTAIRDPSARTEKVCLDQIIPLPIISPPSLFYEVSGLEPFL